MVSLQYVFFRVASNFHFLKMTWHTDHKEMVSLQYEFFYAFSNHWSQGSRFSPVWNLLCIFKWPDLIKDLGTMVTKKDFYWDIKNSLAFLKLFELLHLLICALTQRLFKLLGPSLPFRKVARNAILFNVEMKFPITGKQKVGQGS